MRACAPALVSAGDFSLRNPCLRRLRNERNPITEHYARYAYYVDMAAILQETQSAQAY